MCGVRGTLMGMALADSSVDLGDERQTICFLSGERFSAGDIAAGLDVAVDYARSQRVAKAHRPQETDAL